MQMKNSDMLDRWTILSMKARQEENAKKEVLDYDKEVDDLFQWSYSDGPAASGLPRMVIELAEANAKIWVYESAIRAGKSQDGEDTGLDLEEIGRRALIIRDLNKLRCKAKQDIDQLFGETPDVKIDHASQ